MRSRGSADRSSSTSRPGSRRLILDEPDEFLAVLVRTLWAYRGLGCNLTRTAATLGVHRSTVRYRLFRVRELTRLDPVDPRSLDVLRELMSPHP